MGEALTKMIGDVQFEIGVDLLPGGAAYSEAEITLAATKEGWDGETMPTDPEVGRTCARLLEIASRRWASMPDEMKLGPSEEVNKASYRLLQQSQILRDKYPSTGDGSNTDTQKQASVPRYSSSGINVLPPGVG